MHNNINRICVHTYKSKQIMRNYSGFSLKVSSNLTRLLLFEMTLTFETYKYLDLLYRTV